MAQAARTARDTAKQAYDVSKARAAGRAAPTEGEPNMRLFEPAVTTAREDFLTLEAAQLNYLIKGGLQENDKITAIAAWNAIVDEHDLWIMAMDDQIAEIKAVGNPPVVETTPEEKSQQIKYQIKIKQDEINENTALIETAVNAVTKKMSKVQLDSYMESCHEISQKVTSEILPLYDALFATAVEVEANDKIKQVFTANIDKKMVGIRMKAIANMGLESGDSPSSSGGGGGASFSYKKDELPLFSGKPRDYPAFKREWTVLVAAGKSKDWQLTNLQKRTPDEIDLSNCETVALAWERLDDKYASPSLVSHEIINEYNNWKPKARGDASKLIELEHKLQTMYRDLAAVKQENQTSTKSGVQTLRGGGGEGS